MDVTLSEADSAIAATVAQKMLKAAGPIRPEILANAALMVIQLLCYVHETQTARKERKKKS